MLALGPSLFTTKAKLSSKWSNDLFHGQYEILYESVTKNRSIRDLSETKYINLHFSLVLKLNMRRSTGSCNNYDTLTNYNKVKHDKI